MEHDFDEKTADFIVRTVERDLLDDEERLLFSLGVGLQYAFAPDGVSFSAPYDKMGRELWLAFQYEMYEFLCSEGEPVRWLKELVEGDVRNLILGLVSAITAKYNVETGIAVPVVALVIKSGIINLCSNQPVAAPARSATEIIAKQKEDMERMKERDKPRW